MNDEDVEKYKFFAEALHFILVRSLVQPDMALRWTIIANPKAGGFTINSRWKKHKAAIDAAVEKTRNTLLRKSACPLNPSPDNNGLILTARPGDAYEIAQYLLKTAEKEKKSFLLIITAGGDGTSLEVMQALYQAKPAIRNKSAILRLPMGTGNDGADARKLEDALEFLIKPVHVETQCGLKLSTASGKQWKEGQPFLAFNILSVGLDAFVTHMTNRMKGKLPGDSYKLWVDIAALLYDRVYKVGPMEVKAYDDNGKEIKSFQEKVLLCAMGASGHRSYGSNNMILPDDRNVCVVKQMSLFRKIALKGLFITGKHIDKDESILFNARRIIFSGLHPILAQMDGETTLLEKTDFPAVIELTAPVIPVLKF